jgi:chromosome segregation ATPase
MPKKKTNAAEKFPEKSADVPVTQRMLFEVRDQLDARIKSEIHGVTSVIHGHEARFGSIMSEIHGVTSVIHGHEARFGSIMSEIHGVKSEVHGLRSEIHEVKSAIHGHEAKFEAIRSEIHRLALLVEEQNSRNRIVLDGLTSLFGRQERVEAKVLDFETALTKSK